MNLKLVSRLVGRVLLVEAFFMLLPLAVALLYQEDPAPFLLTILLMAILDWPCPLYPPPGISTPGRASLPWA